MKITNIQTYHIRPRWMFLKIETDEGICGWGESVLEGRAKTVEMAVNEFKPVLIGADPEKIEHLWQTMYRGVFYRGGPILMSAVSGIEMALWDIKGKIHNLPVYQMLGGACRDRVRMYGHLKPVGHMAEFSVEDMLVITRQRLGRWLHHHEVLLSSHPFAPLTLWTWYTRWWIALPLCAKQWAIR